MYTSFLSLSFWLSFILFAVGVTISCFGPGSLIVRRFKLSPLAHLVVSLSLGLIIWAAQGYIGGYLDQRWLAYAVSAVGLFSLIKNRGFERHNLKLAFGNKQWSTWLILVLLIGVYTQVIQVAGSGLVYPQGLGFFRINAYDGVLHLSFISALLRSVPPMEPGALGIKLANYHYWSDLTMAELVRVWHLPIAQVFFQYFPLLLSLLMGFSLIAVLQHWQRSKTEILLATVLLYFGGDLTYLLMLILQRSWGFQAAAIDLGATQFLNMPHSFAKALFLSSLIPLYSWYQTRKLNWGILSVVMLASLFAFKVYFGLFAALILFFLGLVWLSQSLLQSVRRQKMSASWPQLVSQLGAMALMFATWTAVVYLPTNKAAGGLFWSPLEWPKLFLGPENLNWQVWWLRQQVYEAAQNHLAIWALNILAIVICLLCVYGVRMLGALFLITRKNLKDWPWLVSLLLPCYIFTFLGLFTLQTSGGFNVFNFFAVSITILSIILAFNLATVWPKHKLFKLLVLFFLLAAIPRSLFHLYEATSQQLDHKYEQVISRDELQLLEQAREQLAESAVLQSHPANEFDAHTPYVSFISNRQTYFAGEMMLVSHNQDVAQHKVQLAQLFKSSNADEFRNKAQGMGISAIYLQAKPNQQLPFSVENHFTVVAQNQAGIIFKID